MRHDTNFLCFERLGSIMRAHHHLQGLTQMHLTCLFQGQIIDLSLMLLQVRPSSDLVLAPGKHCG